MAAVHAIQVRNQNEIKLEIHQSLAAQVDVKALKAQIGRDFKELMSVLGLTGQAAIKIKFARTEDGDPYGVLSLAINGQIVDYPGGLLSRVYNYVSGEMPEKTLPLDSLLLGLTNLPARQLTSFVRLTSIEIIKGAPAVLFTLQEIGEFWAALDAESRDSINQDPLWLQEVLVPVLEQRISIADIRTVERVLRDSLAEAHSQAMISEDLIAALRPQLVEIHFDSDSLKQFTLHNSQDAPVKFAMMRDGLFYELGVRYPDFTFQPVDDLEPNGFRFKINHLTTAATRGLGVHECLVNETPDRLRLLGIEGRAAFNPANMSLCAIISDLDSDLAVESGLTTWNQLEYLILAMSAELRAKATCFMDRTVVESYLENLSWMNARLVDTFRSYSSAYLLTETLRELLSEEISVRNMREIIEVMISLDHDGPVYTVFDPETAASRRPEREWYEDSTNLASLIRMRMNRTICHKYQQRENVMVVYLLGTQIEDLLAYHHLEPSDQYRIMNAVRSEFEQLQSTVPFPVVLTSASLRPVVRELIRLVYPRVAVLSYHEISPDMNIEPVARITIN